MNKNSKKIFLTSFDEKENSKNLQMNKKKFNLEILSSLILINRLFALE